MPGSEYEGLDAEARAAWEWLDILEDARNAMHHMEFRDLSQIETPPIEWLIRDVWPLGSHGMIGGAEKSFKSFLAAYGALCVATGKPFFDTYEVRQGPVVVFTGEGSSSLLKRRMLRIAAGLGLSKADVEALPIAASSLRMPLTEPAFAAALEASFIAINPRLVIVDPLYAYHGSSSEGGSVYQEGDLLATLSDVTAPAGVALWVVHHFNKGASERGAQMSLSGLTMAGGREWVDSWMLVQKREEPDFDRDRTVKLLLNTGTRQDEVSHSWHVDLKLDERTRAGEYLGGIVWSHQDADAADAAEHLRARDARMQLLLEFVLEAIERSDVGLSISEVRELLREHSVSFRDADLTTTLGRATLTGRIKVERIRRENDSRRLDVYLPARHGSNESGRPGEA